jgi:hypothetical protein
MKTKLNFCSDVERRSKVLSFGKTQINLFFRSLTRTFATVFILTTTLTIASCSQDDDEYNSNMYTLAEKMETRSGGDPGGDDNGIHYQPNECGIWCILYMNKKVNSYQSYSAVVDSAMSNTIGWNRELGVPLYGEQMQTLGNMFGIEFQGWKSNEDNLGNITNCANNTLMELFEDSERFDDKGKMKNVIISIKVRRNGKIFPHYVVVKRYNQKTKKIEIYDVNATGASTGNYFSTVSFDDVLGVIY